MKVKAVKTINEYYGIKTGEEYEVEAIVYFITPYFVSTRPTAIDTDLLRGFTNPLYSYGRIRNETVYIIKTLTTTGRETIARFNIANFEIIDPTTPADWSTADIDLYEQVLAVKDALSYVKDLNLTLRQLKESHAKIVVMGNKQIHSPAYLYEICDDE